MANTPTTNYALLKPASGDTGWGTTMNTNLDALDTHLVGMAQLAGRAGGQTLYGGTAANEDLILHGTSDATRTASYVLLQPTAGNVGIGTTAPTGTLDVAGGGLSLVLGADLSAATRTNVTAKYARIGAYHYTNAEEPMAMIYAAPGATENYLYVGGGTGQMNSATGILFMTAANTTTTTGTEVMRITSAGNVGIGTTAPDSKLHVSLSDTGTNTAAQIVTISHNGGTAAAGFGSRVKWEGESSTTEDREMALLDMQWTDATDATRTSRILLQLVNDASTARWLHNHADATANGLNIFMGLFAGNLTLSPAGGASGLASQNVGIGAYTHNGLTTGYENLSVGGSSSIALTTGYANTVVGAYGLYTCTTGSGNVTVGRSAGYYETGSNKLFIDNAARASEADGRAKALVYGVFAATTAAQTLALNGVVTVLEGLKVTNGSVQVGGTAARATTAGTNRLDIFDGTAPVGTLANGISIYSTAGECYIMDASGNSTLQSPHDPETGEWIFWSRNTVTGRTYRVDMERMVAAIEALTGQSFTTETFESLN